MEKIMSLRRPTRPAKRLFSRQHWPASQLMIAGWLVVVILSSGTSAQNASDGSQNHQLKPKLVSPVVAEPIPEPSSPPTPPPTPPTLEQLPPRAPQVLWDGKQLSIISENSTLAAILTAVRGRTHAVIEIPPGAAAERVAAQLGPAPAREVLTSLLSGSNFDFVILASETDDDAVQSVVLTPRGKGDDTMTSTAASSPTGVRRPPGYFESGRALALESHRDPGPENSGSEPSAALEGGAPSQAPASESVEPASAGGQPLGDTSAQTAAPDVPPADGATAALSDRPTPSAPGASPASAGDASQPASQNSQMVQDLQRMYEQRRKIQMQQNQSNSPPPN